MVIISVLESISLLMEVAGSKLPDSKFLIKKIKTGK